MVNDPMRLAVSRMAGGKGTTGLENSAAGALGDGQEAQTAPATRAAQTGQTKRTQDQHERKKVEKKGSTETRPKEGKSCEPSAPLSIHTRSRTSAGPESGTGATHPAQTASHQAMIDPRVGAPAHPRPFARSDSPHRYFISPAPLIP